MIRRVTTRPLESRLNCTQVRTTTAKRQHVVNRHRSPVHQAATENPPPPYPGLRQGGQRLAYRQQVSLLPSRLAPSARDTRFLLLVLNTSSLFKLSWPPCLCAPHFSDRINGQTTATKYLFYFILYTNHQQHCPRIASARRRQSSTQHVHFTDTINSPQY